MGKMRNFYYNLQQNINFYYVIFIFIIYFFLFKLHTTLVKCEAQSDDPRS